MLIYSRICLVAREGEGIPYLSMGVCWLLSLREAAALCGYSDKTLRHRIRAGALKAEQIIGKYGPEWMVSEQALEEAGFKPLQSQESHGTRFHGAEGRHSAPHAPEQADNDVRSQATTMILAQQEQIGYYKAKADAVETAMENLREAQKETARVYEDHLASLRRELASLRAERDAIAMEKNLEIAGWKMELAEARRPNGFWRRLMQR